MKQFNNTAILTSKNPEAFLNFTWIGEPPRWIVPYCNINADALFINGLDVSTYDVSLGYALLLNGSDGYTFASFHVYTDQNYDFDANLQFQFYDSSALTNLVETVDVSIKNRQYIIPTGEINNFSNDDLLIEDEASYLLVRTNPKFTGNIKLVVDTSENMFLDTFKISDILSNKKYRHQQVSGSSVLAGDIRNVFSTLPLGELYRVDVNDTLDIAIPKTELADQYHTIYNYGAKLLKDELYSEDNGILAPLWINSKMPDYFAAFRLDGVYNGETYDGSALTDLAFKYLEQSDLIRSWSLKPTASLGKYLATHMADTVKLQAPVFLSLTNPDITVAESDPNTWYGTAVDKGIVTGRSETTYFFDQKSQNFTDLNAFISQGFERNTLLCPNMINMEYVFSDEDVELYTMSRYFGLYLTENVLYEIAYYADEPDASIQILSLDGKDSSGFMNSSLVFDPVYGTITDDYKNRIFVLNDEVQLQRITDVDQINGSVSNDYVSKPYKNLFTTPAERTDIAPFITLTVNNALEQGEHLRIINKTQNKIWEVYSVDASQYDCETYCTKSENTGYPTIYRTFFDMNGDIEYQVEQLELAFDRFSDYEGTQFRAGLRGSNWMSIVLDSDANFGEEWAFQRISAPTLNDFNDPSSGFNTASLPEDITFFGVFTPSASDFSTVSYDASYGPIDFELYGDRQNIMIDLINRGSNYLYSFEPTQDIIDKFQEPTLYQGYDGWYRRLLDFDVSTYQFIYVKDPLSIEDKILVMTAHPIQLVKGSFNAYNIYPLNISLMGINPVKDIDYTVYDSSIGFESKYKYNREYDISTYKVSINLGDSFTLDVQGSFVIESGIGTIYEPTGSRSYAASTLFNTFDGSVYLAADTNTVFSYAVLDGSFNYVGYNDNSEENLEDYYDSSSYLKYGLTVPMVAKWVGLGNDCRNNPMRLILNTDVLDVCTNFIPDGSSFTQELTYPSFKYLSDGDRSWEDYIFYDINDVIYDTNDDSYYTFKEMIFKYPDIDFFSKLMYSNHNIDATKTRSSLVYYNQYKNTIDVIFMGLSFSIKVENIAKNTIDIKTYDRYRFAFISTTSKNKDNKRPIEVIINENTETILMIWYQGNDELNYNMRYSSFLPGKSLLDPSSNGFVSGGTEETYSFVKTPFIVRNDTISKNIERLYGKDTTYSSAMVQPYAQLNKNLGGFNSIWNAPGDNTITGTTFNVASYNDYQTFSQYVNYTYAQNANTYGDYVVNYGYNYDKNTNWYANNTTNLDTLKTLLSTSYNYVMYYILRGDEVYNSLDFGGSMNPMTIAINSPRTYRGMSTYNGWFKPSFNSILDFKANEDSAFISLVERDFIFSNTNLRLYNNIQQLWYNKVVSEVTQTDVSTGNAISYSKDFNVFKALWDADYYVKDDTYVDGYQSSDELPAFFGSKLPKFPNDIELNSWDITTASSSQTSSEVTLSYNLTRAINTLFKTNATFLSNWSNFADTDSVIDDYINNTILTYYNISQSKIGVDYYYKSADSQLLHYTLDSSSFIHDNKQNFNGQLAYENDEYIYKILIPRTGNFSYFVSFTLTEK